MGRLLSFRPDPPYWGERLDAVLAAHGCYASRSAAARAVEEGRVTVSGKTVAKKHAVQATDFIVYEADEEAAPLRVCGEPIPLDIRFEDDEVIVLSKQAGLICHPAADHPDGTLVNALVYHCGADHLCNVQGEDDRLGIVHRLDGDTSGLMLAAKTNEAGEALMQAIREKAVERRYLALVHGVIGPDTGMVDAPIDRSLRDRTRRCVREAPSARESITTFRVLERFDAEPGDDGYTLIDCKLFTGRTHQIRVHMEYTRHPLVGDPMYTSGAPKAPRASLGLARQFLHSFTLGFEHPETGEYLEFFDELPEDLQTALDGLAPRSMGKTPFWDETFAPRLAQKTASDSDVAAEGGRA
ncbi:RluA family pseudouridine synthase [Eggerthellaceae bacterium zg-887]|uniref:RluA family pseudouridine synthase n=1 Tax=Xiamenia xianingshaonis TaxID=2682776 RepID=UPI00140CBB46|nr:RluA family pseudouridine synthase [Xiamenia xianingshaonis]NHM16216.1 RluA family pseudouridine synthase [Xiamenia xianingshaonis]